MRALLPPPDAVIDPLTGSPRLGSYRGGLPRVDWRPLGAGAGARLLRHKRWLYVALSTGDVYAALAVVRLGYASNAFFYAYDAVARRMLARRSWMGGPGAGRVGDTGGEGCRASFRARGVSLDVERPAGTARYSVRAEAGDVRLDASLDASAAPPAIGAIALVAPDRWADTQQHLRGSRPSCQQSGASPRPARFLTLPLLDCRAVSRALGCGLAPRVDATEKRALLVASGELRVDGRRVPLDGALAGYDFTSGLLARRTRWRWGFALGRAADGAPLAFNLVEGFAGEPECAAWIGGDLVPLAEGRFSFDAARPEAPWRVGTADGGASLVMTPGAVHAERRNFLVVASRFVQPCGAWTGSLAPGGGRPRVEIARALGVTEDQDVLW